MVCGQTQTQLSQLEQQYRANPANLQVALALVSAYTRLQLSTQAVELLGKLIPALEQQTKVDSPNPQLMLALVEAYAQQQQAPKAVPLLRVLLANPNSDAAMLINVAQICAQMGLIDQLETALTRLAQLQPGNPEAWYDLAAVQATLGKNAEALQSLGHALPLNAQRLVQQPGAKDLRAGVFQDARFNALRLDPEFQKLIAPK